MPEKFKLFLISTFIFSLGNFANSLLILRTIEILMNYGYNQTISQKYSIFFYTLYNVIYMIFSYPAGHVADKYNMKKVLTFGYLLTVIVSIGFMFQSNLQILTLLFFLTGVAAAITNSLSKSMTALLINENTYGIGFGLQTATSGFAFMVANFTVGFLWSNFSPIYGFGYSAIFCFIGTICFLKIK